MKFLSSKVKKHSSTGKKQYFTERIRFSLFVTIIMIVIFTIFVMQVNQGKYAYKVGGNAEQDIKVTQDVIDRVRTLELKEEAMQSVVPVEYTNSTIQVDIKKDIERFFKNLYHVRERYEDAVAVVQKIYQAIERENSYGLDENDLSYLIVENIEDIESVESIIYDFLLQVMSRGIKFDEVELEKERIELYFLSLEEFDERLRTSAIKIMNSSIRENAFVDEVQTQVLIESAKVEVENVIIKEGTTVLRKGERITDDHLEIMASSGLLREHYSVNRSYYLGVITLIVVIFLFIIALITLSDLENKKELKKYYMLGILFVLVFIIGAGISSFSPFLVPIAIFAMVVGLLESSLVGVLLGVFLALLIGLLHGADSSVLAYFIISSTAGALGVKNAEQRSSIFVAGLMVSATNMILLLAFGLLEAHSLPLILTNLGYGLGSGLLCSVLTIGSLPLWENLFKMLTPIKLLELSNPNSPVLKKLLMEASGSYHHSIIVGNLSESAAHAIGANALLARVGSYYHDIGKTERAYFFKENQMTKENPHDNLRPETSAKIIKNHVIKGMALAKQYKLPDEIVDIIEQHHGSTKIKYFYHKAMSEAENPASVNEEDFVYVGRTPRTKVAAIIMLADSCEAAARSMQEHSKENLTTLVGKIVDDKLHSKQLKYCNLTFRDIEVISEQFVDVLMGIYHERIEYPEMEKES